MRSCRRKSFGFRLVVEIPTCLMGGGGAWSLDPQTPGLLSVTWIKISTLVNFVAMAEEQVCLKKNLTFHLCNLSVSPSSPPPRGTLKGLCRLSLGMENHLKVHAKQIEQGSVRLSVCNNAQEIVQQHLPQNPSK